LTRQVLAAGRTALIPPWTAARLPASAGCVRARLVRVQSIDEAFVEVAGIDVPLGKPGVPQLFRTSGASLKRGGAASSPAQGPAGRQRS